jgi:hydrogenase expression/formation protein HypD
MEKFFEVADVNWRGIGNISRSGLELRDEHSGKNARTVFKLKDVKEAKIPGCICGSVVLGKAYPADCILFKKTCSPKSPKGPCMVSMEGACNIWFKTS